MGLSLDCATSTGHLSIFSRRHDYFADTAQRNPEMEVPESIEKTR
jgi:hypothetical protein